MREQLTETAPESSDMPIREFYGQAFDDGFQTLPGETEGVELATPDISGLLNDLLSEGDNQSATSLRRALAAESKGEMTPELKVILDTVIGIKLAALARDDTKTYSHAEALFASAFAGNATDKQVAEEGLAFALGHDEAIRNTRRSARTSLSKERLAEPVGMILNFAQIKGQNITSEQAEVQARREFGMDEKPERLDYHQLSLVHVTDFEPRLHESDGRLHIEPQYDSTGIPRNTIHVALNHMVESSHLSSDWSDKRIVIVAPMNEVVEINGDPSSLVAHDTWWETTPHDGLALPDGTIVIRPGATTAVQVLGSGSPASRYQSVTEIAYKNQAVTETDIDQLFAMADDYELSLVVAKLEVGSVQTRSHSRGNLQGTDLGQATTEFKDDGRQQVRDAFEEVYHHDRERSEKIFAEIAKRVATRQAIKMQGRELIEPKTVIGGEFMSEELSDALRQKGHEIGATGNHASSYTGMVEEFVREPYLAEKYPSIYGNLPGKERSPSENAEFVKNNAQHLSLATLHMYYRMGLF